MCKYCKEMQSFYYSTTNNYIQEVYIEEDHSFTIVTSNPYNEEESINFKINYCPMCGQSLK